MSETENKPKSDAAPVPSAAVPAFVAETREQRLMKYGANVVLSSILVIALAVILVFAAQKWTYRQAVGGSDVVSLKPQTVSIIKEIDQPIKLVSLYPKLTDTKEKDSKQGQYQRIIDTLDEYRRKGKNIEFDAIDPVADPVKVDQWLGEVTRKYGGNVKAHRDLLETFPKTLAEIRKLADGEANKMLKLPQDVLRKIDDQDLADALNGGFSTVQRFPLILGQIDEQIQKELKEKLPNYKGAVTALQGSLSQFSTETATVRKAMDEVAKNEKAPKEIRDYATSSLANFDQMKKLADDEVAKIKGLGELKVNDVYRRLSTTEDEKPAPAIAVMGATDIKLIDVDDLWKSGESTGMAVSSSHPDDTPKFRFTGEQRITAAILALSKPQKQMIVFVRGGGPPKLAGGMMGHAYSEITDRLHIYNFDVKEKDVSGQAMQAAMMQQQPPPEEASEAEMKSAIWVVFAEPMQSRFGMAPANPVVAKKLKEHLDEGGSAVVMISLRGDDLSEALKDWGVQAKPNVIAVHDPVPSDTDPGEDFVERARRVPYIFVINDFGGPHPITDPIQSLDAAIVPMIPIVKTGATDATITQLLPVPTSIPAWGESDTSFLFGEKHEPPTFDPATDLATPLFCGAAVERKGKGRIVVLGASDLVRNELLMMPDPKLLQRGINVVRFPGNGELFMNSIFWLAKQEKLIALSPAAMDTPRVQPIPAGILNFWRYGIILIGLPLLTLIGGAVVWRRRSNEN